jgi:phosphoglycolate phosphatase
LRKIALVILDLDGTLYSSTATTLGAVERAVRDLNARHGLGIERPSGELVLSGVGLTRKDFAKRVFPSLEGRLNDEMDKLIWHWERALIREGRGSLFPGADEALEELSSQGYALAIATNAGRSYMDEILDGFELRRYFRDARCAGAEKTADKSELILGILDSLGTQAARAVMVGDRRSDIDAAKRAGTFSVGCTWGFGSEEELAGADRVIDRFSDLPGIVETWV